jgi:hypothetical protein
MAEPKQSLIARFEESASDVALSLTLPGVGVQESRVPLSVFMSSLGEWMKGEEVARAREDAGSSRILAALEAPEKWQVNALATPLHYALCVEGDWRLAVRVRPERTIMNLRYVEESPDTIRTLTYAVPPRLIAGVWLKGHLRAGIIALSTDGTTLPIAPNDTQRTVTPWIWGNVSYEGQVCFGTTTRPPWGQDGVSTIERTFFESAFNSDICRFVREREDPDDDEPGYHNLLSYHEMMVTEDTDIVEMPTRSSESSPRTLAQLLKYSIHQGW